MCKGRAGGYTWDQEDHCSEIESQVHETGTHPVEGQFIGPWMPKGEQL